MNREIKFRGWNDSEMIYPNTVFTSGDILKRCSVVMQFTGLFDRNEKEIYEGDLIVPELFFNASQYYGKIIFSQGAFRVEKSEFYTSNSELRNVLSRGKAAGNYYLVRGNIHENPELLEVAI